jgi:hypothetical protein
MRTSQKLLSSAGLAIAVAAASLLSGCQLYFGDHKDSGSNSNPQPPNPGGAPVPPGFACTTDVQCAAGCFCADGTCTEAGFCKTDTDCGTGFTCDTARSSCKPLPSCTADGQCSPGSACDAATGSCVVTCKCASDAEAVQQGAGWCDETRSTCMAGTDPAGACTTAVTCTTGAPACGEGQVPLVKDGCYTGTCRDIAVCEAAPACSALQHQDDCASRSADCSEVFTGFNCHGTTCGVSDVDCTCASYNFTSCHATNTTTNRLLIGD